MREIKFRAVISPTTTIYFTLFDLVDPMPIFSIRELLKPWLQKHNNPDGSIGKLDKNDKNIYGGDVVRVRWEERGRIIEDHGYYIVYWCPQELAWRLQDKTTNREWDTGDYYYGDEIDWGRLTFEVVGNIYEGSDE